MKKSFFKVCLIGWGLLCFASLCPDQIHGAEQVPVKTSRPEGDSSRSTVVPGTKSAAAVYDTVAVFPLGNKLGSNWSQKVNVKLSWNAEEKHVAVDIDGTEFGFGWFQRGLPDVSYSKYSGIFGRFRVQPGQKAGRIIAMILLRRESQGNYKQEYYSKELGTCGESRGEWVDFFLPFNQFRASREATKEVLSSDMIKMGDRLEISVGAVTGQTRLEFAGFRLVTPEEEKTMVRVLNRRRLGRLLKPEDELTDSVHPRLLLTGSRLRRVRAKAKEGGVQQAGYEQLIRLADQAMKKINADNPFGKAFAYTKNPLFNEHVNRGRFEGTMNPLVIPLETLAAAAVITGQEKYAKHAVKALVNMARTIDVDCPEINLGFYYTRTFYIRALAFGYDWLWQYMTPAERKEVKITLLGFVQDIYDRSWTAGWGRHPLNRVWNWDPGLVSCAGLALLAMEGETNTAENAMLIQFRRHLRDYLTFGIDFDGCCHEGPSYISYGIGSGIQFAECLRDMNYGDLFLETNWRLIAPWLVSELLPNHGYWNNLSDCNHGQVAGCPVYAYTCGRLAELAKTEPVVPGERMAFPHDTKSGLKYISHFSEKPGEKQLTYGALAELMGWCWNQGTNASDPSGFSDADVLAFVLFYEECPIASSPGIYLPESMFFRGRGLVVVRSGGYETNAIHLAVEAGPHAAGHDQGDKGTFTFRAYGADMVIDSGYGNDGDKLKSGSGLAHNVVLIDGQGQPINWHNSSNGEITGYSHSDAFDWIRADAKGAWNYRYSSWLEEPSGIDVEKADRHYVFVRGDEKSVPPYLITFDDIRKKDGLPHAYTWQWHTSPEFTFTIEKDRWTAKQGDHGYRVLTTEHNRPSGSARFTLTAPKTGKYNIAGLTRCAGEDLGKSNSFYIQIGKGPRLCWDLMASHAFSWSMVRDRDASDFLELELKQGEQVSCELIAREPQAQLAFLRLKPIDEKHLPLPDPDKKKDDMVPATMAVLNEKNPLLLQESSTTVNESNMTVFPITTPDGKTEFDWFETTRSGIHPRLTHTVTAVEPAFLMVFVPRPNQAGPLPKVHSLRHSGTIGVELRWPGGWIDRLAFTPGENGMEPMFQRNHNKARAVPTVK